MKSLDGKARKDVIQSACDKMHENFLIGLFDVIDDEEVGYIKEDSLGFALERAGIVVDEQTLALMIQVGHHRML